MAKVKRTSSRKKKKSDGSGLFGTPLSSSDFKKKKIFTAHGAPNAEYAWDTGVGIGRYLEELKAGRLEGRFCPRCDRIMIPPRMFCEWCFRPTTEWVTLKNTGIVNTFSLCNIRWDMVRLKEPQIPAVIEIDGASKGMGIMHMLGKIKPEKIHIGMRVKAIWKPENEREGAITDIAYWTSI